MNTVYLKLIKDISKYIPLSKEDIRTISESFSSITIPKNTMLEVENTSTKYLYFIINGYVRVFYTKEGEERTTQINCPSGFITSFQSFITNSKAYDNVQTISECNLLRVTKDSLDKLNKNVKDWGIYGEKIYEQALIYNEDRTRDMILLTAEERYLKLMKTQPDIIQNVSLQYIASYIGIKPESLSRIRRQITF
ncbi:Crp/Fnr family transcriptional regulator [Empedobacter sp. GD03797]|uniref:Crp/Fnr family transcriptional regulator n=1 Tax=Empedobacter sp. GD03797 TaxID=2975382 RepID=UPI002447FEB9|nr:Crp/Fnr family transcriptional regulator [Empedobacter sp. GD03797]MDH1884218.1 Crp/Fnr family transcriptional regulator [Empedobacter sp. GD03797]